MSEKDYSNIRELIEGICEALDTIKYNLQELTLYIPYSEDEDEVEEYFNE